MKIIKTGTVIYIRNINNLLFGSNTKWVPEILEVDLELEDESLIATTEMLVDDPSDFEEFLIPLLLSGKSVFKVKDKVLRQPCYFAVKTEDIE